MHETVSVPRDPQPVKLIASVIYGDEGIDRIAIDRLAGRFGEPDSVSPEMRFDFTDYYAPEFGAGLMRRVVSFRELVSPGALPDIKLFTNAVETTLAREDGRRRVNIDPGYIALCHLVLASCKPFAHRPYLGNGVYADLTLLYRGKTFEPLPWTFPDYRSAQMIGLLNRIREQYYHQIKTCRATGGETEGRP